MMEDGAYGIDVGMAGYPNGASLSYSLYLVILIIVFLLFKNKTIFHMKSGNSSQNPISFLLCSLILNLFFLSLLLFAFGGINVLLGSVLKGEFRTSLGFFGFLPFMIIKYFSPGLLAYSTLLYMKHKNRDVKICYFLNLFLTGIIGLTFGFKSTSITMLLPSFILLFWNANIWSVLKLSTGVFSFLIFTSMLFDRASFDASSIDLYDINYENALSFIIYRLTVLQGNTIWLVWEKYVTGYNFPSYWPTLLAAFGDKTLSIFGVNLDDLNTFAQYHFDVLLTALASDSYESRIDGHNVTGTAFSDGLFIGGIYGVIFIAGIAGFVVSQSYHTIKKGIEKNNALWASMSSVYFLSFVYQWLNGGGITTLFHISTVFGLALSIGMIKLIKKVRISNEGVFLKQ
jgi:oligosaccharide repeat unit polymerase